MPPSRRLALTLEAYRCWAGLHAFDRNETLAWSRSRLRHALWRQANADQSSIGQNLVASRAGRIYHSQGSDADTVGGALIDRARKIANSDLGRASTRRP